MPSLMLRTSCVVIILLCTAAVHASPVVGTEVRVCPTFSPAPGNHEGVEIAGGAGGYLAVWQDSRGGEADVFGCRISATGEMLDDAGISICPYPAEQLDPAIAWNGNEYLVVWADRRLGAQHIYCTRVRPTGEVLDPQGIGISGTNGTQAYPRVASDGKGWQVVWQDSRGGSQDIYGCRVNGDGSLGKVMGIVTLGSNNEETPDVAYNGSTFVVVWRDQRNSATTDADIYGCRVSKNGLRMGSDILVSCDSTGAGGLAGAQHYPRISPCGSTNCMVAWEDYRNASGNGDIYVARLNSSGSVMDRQGIAVATGTAAQEMPGIGFDGSRMLVGWRDRTNRYVRGSRVSTSGSVLDTSGFNISLGAAGSAGISVCGCADSGFFAGWNSLSMAGNDALVAKVPRTGTFAGSAGTFLSLGLDDQTSYSVVDNGTEYVAVWSQEANYKHSILAARVSHSGELLTSTAVNLTESVYGEQTHPSIAWNGSEYLVAWSGNETYDSSGLDIRGYRLDSSLQIKDASPIVFCAAVEDQTMPSVASNGSKFLVAWEDSRNALAPTYYTDIYGAIVDAAGGVTALGSAISMSTGNQRKPSIASNGTDYYVAWEDYRSGSPATYGVKVSSSGSVASALGTAMPSTSYSQTTPFVCYGGGSYMVTWSDGAMISGCRVTPAGVISDAAGINVDAGATVRGCPSAWWDGSQYQFAWEDYRSQFAGNSDIYYITVGSNGVVSSDPKSGLVADLSPQLRPRIFGDVSSGMLFYSRYENYSNGICFAPLTQQGLREVASITAAKQMPTGSLVMLRGKVVTGVFPGCFYAEEVDRSSAIKVVSSVTVHAGDMVDVTGTIGTCDAERQLTTGSVVAMGVAGSPTMPFGIRGDMLGGAGIGAVPGVTGGIGAYNVGLLMKTWGKVTSVGSGYFNIEPRPGMSVKVKSGSLLQPAVGKLVSVVGISTCEVTFSSVSRAIRPRQQSDIVLLN